MLDALINKLSQIQHLLQQINCNLTDSDAPPVGFTEGAPVDPPEAGDPSVLIDLSTGVIYYFDSDSLTWEVAAGDTHMGNTDLTFTGNRTYDVSGNEVIYNDAGHFEINAADPQGIELNNLVGTNSASVFVLDGRVDINATSSSGTDYSSVNVDDASVGMSNSAGAYYLGDGFFALTPTLDDVTADFGIGISSLTGRLYRTTKPTIPTVSDTVYGAGWNGDTTGVASKNAIYDKIETVVSSIPSVTNIAKDQIGILIDGSGSAITTGFKGRYRVPYSGTITGWTIIEATEVPITTTSTVDVKLGTYANYDTTPTFASIAGSEKPTITNSEKGQDLTLTTWTTAVTAGDFIEYTVDSNNNAKKLMLFIDITKS